MPASTSAGASLSTPFLQSKLPGVGTTVFSVVSALAAEHGAVNLGQGFPDFACDPQLVEAVYRAMRDGHNQYPPMPGVLALRQAVAAKIAAVHQVDVDPEAEITITAGATQAITTAIFATVRAGDEVVVLEPCYDCYVPMVELAGGTVVRVPLEPGTFRPDFDRIAAAIGLRTRAVIVNTPHNPSGTVWRRDDMLRLQAILEGTPVLLISDEVYEHMVFDGAAHESALRFEGLRARAFVVGSFGKTFHVTGWKVGSVVAPPPLMAEFRKVHQFNVFTVNTPVQHALAAYLQDPAPYRDLPAFYQRKRDLFRAGLAPTGLRLLPCEGSYFQCVDISTVSALPAADFCRWAITEFGVAGIPMSAFYGDGFDNQRVRFCFAKEDATLHRALQRLGRL